MERCVRRWVHRSHRSHRHRVPDRLDPERLRQERVVPDLRVRIEREVHGPSYEQADAIGREIHRLRRQAEKLRLEAERFVSNEESATVSRGHPLRRAADRGGARSATPQKPS